MFVGLELLILSCWSQILRRPKFISNMYIQIDPISNRMTISLSLTILFLYYFIWKFPWLQYHVANFILHNNDSIAIYVYMLHTGHRIQSLSACICKWTRLKLKIANTQEIFAWKWSLFNYSTSLHHYVCKSNTIRTFKPTTTSGIPTKVNWIYDLINPENCSSELS